MYPVCFDSVKDPICQECCVSVKKVCQLGSTSYTVLKLLQSIRYIMDFFVLLTWVFFIHQAVARSSNGVSEKLPENVPQLFTLNLDKNLKEALEGLTRVEGPLSIDLSGFITNGKSFNASFKVKVTKYLDILISMFIIYIE
ncbi:unnamed protein product [Toxocara canis]|uniref:Gnk2-homologous domain-containing protein n=1 Tax=Toxocara canis TaxID=6265 RepID=A0A183VAD9_TOXCA|nr:unnamed protein product [Toxocara canis]